MARLDSRAYDRLAAAISILLLTGLGVGSFYLAELSQRGAGGGPRRLTHEPDFFVDNFVLTRLDAQGEPMFRMSAQRMFHYPDDDSTEYVKPHLVSLDPKQPLVTLTADRGTADAKGDHTHLYDNVLLTRAAVGDHPPLRVTTDYVLLLAQEDIARTDHPVRIQYGESTLTGVGMVFNNAARSLDVLSDVHGTWVAPPPSGK